MPPAQSRDHDAVEPNRRTNNALLFLGMAALVGLMAWVPGLGCPTKQLTGVPCPGCGMTRATLALARLDPGAAFGFHPMVFMIVPYLAVVAGVAILPRRAPSARFRSVLARVGLALAISLVAVWTIRLYGGLGGLPDPIEPGRGFIGRLFFG